MEKVWRIITEKKSEELSIVENILYSRGITDKEEINEFLSHKPQKTYSPFSIKNMIEAVGRIIYHIKKGNKIVISGDYDVDGVTATALLLDFFGDITNNIDYYIPNRFTEGYGLNLEAIKYMKEEMKADLIITVDNGISSVKEVDYAKELGLEIIVTDHHNPPEKLPDCLIIDVKQEGDEYPFKELCGCGVAFKLAQAIQKTLGLPKTILSKLLDLVTLGTICDIVPLIDENRTLIKYGLKSINANKRLGIAILRQILGLKDKEITAGRIGFGLGPCFNAAGRLEDAKHGVQLLLEKDIHKATKLAKYLYDLNRERRSVQEAGEKLCKRIVEEKYMDDDFLVLRADEISEGVIGIVAGKIKDTFYKPTLVVTKSEDGQLKGSGRSISGINIYEEMKTCSDLFLGFGGHEMACGFSIEEDKLDELRSRLDFRAKRIRIEKPDIFVPKLNIMAEISPNELTIDLVEEISKLEPYGMSNPKPLFMVKNIKVDTTKTRGCGTDGKHLKFVGNRDNVNLDGIGFSLTQKYIKIGKPDTVDIAFFVDINEWNGNVKAQMIIEDFKKTESIDDRVINS
ncbi:single-stranded-DNA-specific exonuclease RecJ [Paramaledivibacter caminithermalis]|uniref:Single-stranded-DNA-specific exonuclease RecJ n=1 Tax=Paramaledivibacter caminithermalis (strain DSM 15212 / CIP 107654 / DViRD3) TaxID=1121301 RepID=A0A1M6K1D2_PARC5|nr:single-stranded-DNA-specific exonuclease RecJ [Paramaledivibacter caminithermalis]SHJ52724.1 single-stranded-DNA-specific exonuclease [Paramaledivibacter caminithermalis DSM 15212]